MNVYNITGDDYCVQRPNRFTEIFSCKPQSNFLSGHTFYTYLLFQEEFLRKKRKTFDFDQFLLKMKLFDF